MNVGDLVRITYTATLEKDRYGTSESKIAMIIEARMKLGR